MNVKVFFLLIGLIVGLPLSACAQGPTDERSGALGDFLRNPIQRVIQSVQTPGPQKREGGMEDAINSPRPVRNPFIPALPAVSSPEGEKPIVNVPAPDNNAPSIETVKPAPPPKTRPSFQIQGLVWNTDRPQAIINDQVFNLGDTIESWTISAIERSGVSVTSDNITFVIEP